MSVFYRSFRSGERPPPVRLYALSGSAQAIRASQAAAAASGEHVFGDRLTWLTPQPGESRPCDSLAGAARGADLLIHEVGDLDARAQLVHQVGHSTAADAGRTAARAGVRALALFHMPAPEWVSPPDLLAEARRHAPGVEIFLSEDGMVWKV